MNPRKHLLHSCAHACTYSTHARAHAHMHLLHTCTHARAHLQRKQNIKLQLFRRFRCVLIVSVVFSVCWAVYTMAASVKGYFEEHWKSQWNVNAVWEVSVEG